MSSQPLLIAQKMTKTLERGINMLLTGGHMNPNTGGFFGL